MNEEGIPADSLIDCVSTCQTYPEATSYSYIDGSADADYFSEYFNTCVCMTNVNETYHYEFTGITSGWLYCGDQGVFQISFTWSLSPWLNLVGHRNSIWRTRSPVQKFNYYFHLSISDCQICQAEEGVDYQGNDLNWGITDSQTSLASCVSFCQDTFPEATHYSYVDGNFGIWDNSCWCKDSDSGRRYSQGVTSGALSC